MILVKKIQKSAFWFINFGTQGNEFPVKFNMFVNMFWRAEGFGCMWVSLKCGFLKICCLLFILELQKTLELDKKNLVGSPFSSLFNLQQVHRNLNQTLDICVKSKAMICFFFLLLSLQDSYKGD